MCREQDGGNEICITIYPNQSSVTNTLISQASFSAVDLIEFTCLTFVIDRAHYEFPHPPFYFNFCYTTGGPGMVPVSAYKTVQAIEDFDREELPLTVANW